MDEWLIVDTNTQEIVGRTDVEGDGGLFDGTEEKRHVDMRTLRNRVPQNRVPVMPARTGVLREKQAVRSVHHDRKRGT